MPSAPKKTAHGLARRAPLAFQAGNAVKIDAAHLLENRWISAKKNLSKKICRRIEALAGKSLKNKALQKLVNQGLEQAMAALKHAVEQNAPKKEIKKLENRLRTAFWLWDARNYLKQQRTEAKTPVPENPSRRRFLKKVVLVGAGLAAVGGAAVAFGGKKPKTKKRKKPNK